MTRRTVPLDRADEYEAAWHALADRAREEGVRAWIFRTTGHDDRFTEFLEWTADGDSAPLAAERASLDPFGPAQTELLEET